MQTSSRRISSQAAAVEVLPPSTSSDYCTLKVFQMPVKSKLGAEYRRFSLAIPVNGQRLTFDEFREELFSLHLLTSDSQKEGITIEYTDVNGVGHLPINSDQVSAIVDVDILPVDIRRVQLCKFHTNMPLGFYIRDGISFRPSHVFGSPPEAVSGIYISRLIDNGLAASTNLLHENDEILEVNGITVSGKTLDQVTDVMIANSYNLILTVRPAHQDRMRAHCSFPSGLSPPPSYGSAAAKAGSRSPFLSGLRSYLETPTYGSHSSRGSGPQSRENAVPFPSHPSSTLPSSGFSRNTTVRLSDKLRNERVMPSPGELRRLRRPFSLYVPSI